MTDLISREEAIDAVEESRRLNHHQDGKEACAHEYEHRHFLKILRDLPSAYPKKGKWIKEHLTVYLNGTATCSECGGEAIWNSYGKQCLTKFCPNCGADMRGN